MGLSPVCDCGISSSYSLTIFKMNMVIHSDEMELFSSHADMHKHTDKRLLFYMFRFTNLQLGCEMPTVLLNAHVKATQDAYIHTRENTCNLRDDNIPQSN